MSRLDLFDPDHHEENRLAHWVLLALAITLLIALYACAREICIRQLELR